MTSLPLPKTIYEPEATYSPATHVAGVRFQKLGKLYHFDFTDYADLRIGDHVIVETARGQNMGQVMGFAEREDEVRKYKPIMRIASSRDILLRQQWKEKELPALIECREKAAEIGNYEGVKFVAAEYNYDGSTLTFLYSTEDNVNIHRIRKTMRQQYNNCRVEFRQIGPRDVARIMGGQGACGGPRCCSTFLTDFSPISIKMAKAQDIPLNPTEITGMCGRLRCCLIYEYEQYVEARKQLPRQNQIVGTPDGEGRVIDIYPLRDGVLVRYEEGAKQFVAREDIVPLEEFRALKAKAAQGCSKNEGGGCDCGSRRPKSASGDLADALEAAHGKSISTEAIGEEEKKDDDRNRQRKSRRRKKRPFRKGKKSDDDGQAPANKNSSEQKATSQSKSSKRKRRRRKRKKRNQGNNNQNND